MGKSYRYFDIHMYMYICASSHLRKFALVIKAMLIKATLFHVCLLNYQNNIPCVEQVSWKGSI